MNDAGWMTILVSILAAVIVVGFVVAWVMDRKRSDSVAGNEQRAETEPNKRSDSFNSDR